jgi:hypothetical protein
MFARRKIQIPIELRFIRTQFKDGVKYCEFACNGEQILLPAMPDHAHVFSHEVELVVPGVRSFEVHTPQGDL